MTFDDSGWLWLTLAVSQESARVSQSQPESARVSHSRPESADYGQHWWTLADSGWLWLTITDSGGQPESARVSQSHQKSSRVDQSQPVSARFCQSQQKFYIGFGLLLTFWGPWGAPKEFVFGKTGAKLLLWPPNWQMKHTFIFMVTFQSR